MELLGSKLMGGLLDIESVSSISFSPTQFRKVPYYWIYFPINPNHPKIFPPRLFLSTPV